MRVKSPSILRSIISVVVVLSAFKAFGDYEAPTTTTNVNEKTNFFETQIDDKRGLEQMLESHKALHGVERNGASGLDGVVNLNEAENSGEVQNLKAIDASNLETEGNRKYATEEGAELMSMHVDLSDPLLQAEKRDLEKIADDTEKGLGNLMIALKKEGIDCKEEAGPVLAEPVFTSTKVQEKHRDTFYDKALCEELKNQYNCSDILSVRCSDPSTVGGAVKNVTGNMVHTISGDGTLIIGVNQERYFYNNWGSQQDYEFSFDVENAAAVASFNLMNVDWADYVLIKLNDNIIFQEPGVRGKIEMSTNSEHYRLSSKGERFYGLDIGVGDYVCVNTRAYHSRAPHSEVKHLLKNGKNTLKIRLAYGNGGKIHVVLQYKEKVCNAWQESWSESCILK
jgi:hypothetical protein